MGRKPKIFPHIPATMEEVVQAIFRPSGRVLFRNNKIKRNNR